MNALMTIQVRVLSAQALAQLRAIEAQSNKTANGVGGIGRQAQWGLPYLSKWGNQVQWAGRQLIYNFTLPIAMAMGAATKFALENEKAMTRVVKVYGDGTKRFNRLAKTELPALAEAFEALSNRFGVHQAQVIEIAGDWAAAGASGLALAKSVKLTLETMVLGELEAAEATRQLIAIQAQYGFNTTKLTKTIDILNMVENQTGASMKNLMDAMSRAAGVARTAGIDVEHLAAMTAALVPAAGSAATAGNGLKTIISRILSPTTEAVELLNEMGIAVNETAWTSQDATSRIELLAEKFNGLSDAQKNVVATSLGSRWQLNRLVVLMQAVTNENSYYHRALESVNDEQKIFNQRQKELQAVLESNPQRMQQAWVIIKNAMTRVIVPLIPFITYLASEAARLANAFANLSIGTQKWIIAGLVLLALIGPIARYIGSLSNLIGLLSATFHFGGAALMAFGSVVGRLIAGPFVMLGRGLNILVQVARMAFWAIALQAVKMSLAIGKAFALIPVLTRGALATTTALWAGWMAAMRGMLIGFLTAQRIIWLTYSVGLVTLQRALLATIYATWALFTSRLPQLLAAMFVRLAAIVRIGMVALVNPYVAGTLAILGIAYAFRDQLAAAWNATVDATRNAWVPIVDFFYDVVEAIQRAFWSLPEGIQNAFIAVINVVRDAALAVYEWMSYLNPFARHSPSLVESVTAGMDIIERQYARAAGLGGIFQKAARDLAAFKKQAGRGGEFADERKKVVKSGGPVGLFDALYSDLQKLTPIMQRQEAAVKRQEAVVDRWSKRLDAVNARLDTQRDKLGRLRDRLDKLNDKYAEHQQRLQDYASAPIKGMGAMEDAIFANEMAQKRLRLEMLKWEQANGSVDNLRNRLAMLMGDIETMRGRLSDLRGAGAGSEITGPLEAQIAAMEAQARAMAGAANTAPIAKMQDELDKLQREGEILDLEKSLKFDPLLREIDKLVNAQEELAFDKIIAGIKREQAAMEALRPKIEEATRAVEQQEQVIDQIEKTRDRVQKGYDREQTKLNNLRDAYQKTAEMVRELEAALRDLGSVAGDKLAKAADKAKKAAEPSRAVQQFRAGAGGNWPDPGGKAKIGREGGFGDQSGAIRKFAEAELAQMHEIFGGFDMFAPLKEMWADVVAWFKERVGPWAQRLRDRIGGALGGIGESFDGSGLEKALGTIRDKTVGAFEKIKEWAGRLWALFGDDVMEVVDAIKDAAIGIWNKWGPELAKFGDLIKPLGIVIKNLWNLIVVAFKTLAPIVLAALKVISSVIANTLGPVLDMVVDVFSGIIQVVRGAFEVILGIFTLDGALLWQGVKSIFGGLIDIIWGILKGAAKIIWGVVSGIVEGIFDFFVWLYDVLVGNSIVPDIVDGIFTVFKTLVKLAKWIWENVLKPIYNFFKELWDKWVKPALSAWWAGIQAAWALLKQAGQWIWNNVLKPVYDKVKDLWDKYVKPAFSAWWEGIKAAWALLKTIGQWFWENVLKPIFQKVKDIWELQIKPELGKWRQRLENVWDNLTKIAGWVWNNVLKPIKDKFVEGWNAIKDWFDKNADIILTPIRSVTNKIVDAINWIIKGLNKLSNLPGLSFHIDTIPEPFAQGGPLPSKRVGGGFKTSGARAIVGEGKANYPEYVIPTDPTYRRRAQMLLAQAAPKVGMAGVPMHAKGGILGKVKDAFGKAKDFGKGALDWLGDKAKDAASKLFGPLADIARGIVNKIDWPIGRKVGHGAINLVTDWVKAADKAFEDKMGKITPPRGETGSFPVSGGDWERTYWRGHQFNVRTIKMIQAAERILGQAFHITQGSWSTSVAASGSTHAGGGVFDATSPISLAGERALRQAGFAAWIRSPSQGPWPYHYHAVAIGDPTASASAKWQVQDYLRGGIGLAKGAVVRARYGGTQATIGEGGNDEAVIPLPRNWRTDVMQSGSGGGDTIIQINGDLEFPNIKTGEDAEVFIANLKSLAGGAA